MNGIDTSAMLTMLGLIAAVWAVVPGSARLGFRLSLSTADWVVIWSLLLAIHVLFFERELTSLGIYPDLGPYRFGLDKSGTQYLLFLALGAYVYVRSKSTRLNRWNISLFEELARSLLHTRKFDELGILLERHLTSALDLATEDDLRGRLSSWIRPDPVLPVVELGPDGRPTLVKSKQGGAFSTWIRNLRSTAAETLDRRSGSWQQSRAVTRTLLSSRELVHYLAASYPYFCLELMERGTRVVEGFQDEFFVALLEDESSVLYAELRNSENLEGPGHRLALADEHCLLRFYFSDIDVARRLAVYRSVGEAMIGRIDADDTLSERLNGPMLTYGEAGKNRCPIYVGTKFFRMMVSEGLHQRMADHLWLHYLPHFAERLIARARESREADEDDEFAAPMAYLLHELVDIACSWIADATHLTTAGVQARSNDLQGDHVYVSFEATKALGLLLRHILPAERVPARVRDASLTTVLYTLRRVEEVSELAELSRALRTNVVTPSGSAERGYLHYLESFYEGQDHMLRGDLPNFERVLVDAVNRL